MAIQYFKEILLIKLAPSKREMPLCNRFYQVKPCNKYLMKAANILTTFEPLFMLISHCPTYLQSYSIQRQDDEPKKMPRWPQEDNCNDDPPKIS